MQNKSSNIIRVIALITLAAFVLTQPLPSYALRSVNPEESRDTTDAIAAAMGGTQANAAAKSTSPYSKSPGLFKRFLSSDTNIDFGAPPEIHGFYGALPQSAFNLNYGNQTHNFISLVNEIISKSIKIVCNQEKRFKKWESMGWVISPYGSITYLLSSGAGSWNDLSDIDLEIYLDFGVEDIKDFSSEEFNDAADFFEAFKQAFVNNIVGDKNTKTAFTEKGFETEFASAGEVRIGLVEGSAYKIPIQYFIHGLPAIKLATTSLDTYNPFFSYYGTDEALNRMRQMILNRGVDWLYERINYEYSSISKRTAEMLNEDSPNPKGLQRMGQLALYKYKMGLDPDGALKNLAKELFKLAIKHRRLSSENSSLEDKGITGGQKDKFIKDLHELAIKFGLLKSQGSKDTGTNLFAAALDAFKQTVNVNEQNEAGFNEHCRQYAKDIIADLSKGDKGGPVSQSATFSEHAAPEAHSIADAKGAAGELEEKIWRIEDDILQRKAKEFDVSYLADINWSGALISDDKALDEIVGAIFTKPISESMQRVGRKMFYFPRQARKRSLTRAEEKAIMHMKEILNSEAVKGKKDKEAKTIYLFAAMFKALLMQDEADIKLPYVPHSIAHVVNVVEAAEDLIQKMSSLKNGLVLRYGNNGRMAALLTAWLHDIGYSILDEAERKVSKEFEGFNKQLPTGEEMLKTRKGYHARLSARMFEAEIVTIKDKKGENARVSLASLVNDIFTHPDREAERINLAEEMAEAILLHGADKPDVLSDGMPGTGKNAYTKASDTDKLLLFCVRDPDTTDIMSEFRFHSYQGSLWFLKLLEELAGDTRDIKDLTDQELKERNNAIKTKFKNLVDLGNLSDSVPYSHRVAQLIIQNKINETAARQEAINEFRTILENLDRFDQTNFEHFAGCVAILGYERIYDKDKGYILKVYLSKSKLESFADPEVAETQVKRIEEAFQSLSVDGKPVKISKKIVDDTKFYGKRFLAEVPPRRMPASERKTLGPLARYAAGLSSGNKYFSFFTEKMWQRLLTRDGVAVVSNGKLKKGEILIEQDQAVSINGTNEPAMFFILEGVFEIYDKYTGLKLGELSAGDVLGEIGPILGRRIASARVKYKNRPAKVIKIPVRIYNELIRDYPVFADKLADIAAERMAQNKELQGRDREERAKIDRILRWISLLRDHLDYTFTKAKEEGNKVSVQEIDEVARVLESQDRLGSVIYNENIEKGDLLVVFEVPGIATSGRFGIKQLNDKLGYELNSRLIDIRRETLKRLMAEKGLIYSTYKEDVFLVKGDAARRIAKKKGKTISQLMDEIRRDSISEITDILLADSNIFKRTLIKNGVKIKDLKGTIFEIRVGISRVEGNSAEDKIRADINAHQAAAMEAFFKNGIFSKARYKIFISHIRTIRQGLIENAAELKIGMFEYDEKGRAYLTQETAGILRKRAAWQELTEAEKAFFGNSEEFYQLSVEYMNFLNVQDYIKKWQLDFYNAKIYSKSAKDVVTRLKGLREAASKQEHQGQAYIITAGDTELFEEARRILMQNPKAPGISSEYDFYLRGPPMEKAVHVTLDVRNMGIMNIREFQGQIQDIENVLLDREKEDWPGVYDIWMSAANDVTKNFLKVQGIIKDTLSKHGLSEADYVLSIGGDESNIVVNGNKFSPGLLLAIKNNIAQGTDGRMAVRACATRSAEKYRKKFASRGKEHAMRLAHAMAMLDSEKGTAMLKFFESKGIKSKDIKSKGNDIVLVQNQRGAWRQYPAAPAAGVEAKMTGEAKPMIAILTDNIDLLRKDLEEVKSFAEYKDVEAVLVDISDIDGLSGFNKWKNSIDVLKLLDTVSATVLRIYANRDLISLFTGNLNEIKDLSGEVDFNDGILQLIQSV